MPAYKTDFSNVAKHDWGFGHTSLGLISWYNVITFHRAELSELPNR